MDITLAAIINAIRYKSDAECEYYLRAVLESLPPKRLARAIQIANEVQASRPPEPTMGQKVGFVLPKMRL